MIKIIISIIATLLASLGCGILYRMGGAASYETKWRDLGMNMLMNLLIAGLIIYNQFCNWWILLAWFVSVPLMLASLSSYWDFLDKGEKNWLTWTVVGFFYGLSALPFCLYSHRFLGATLRIVILSIFVPTWNKKHPLKITTIAWSKSKGFYSQTWDGAQIEEFGRGCVTTITTPLILL